MPQTVFYVGNPITSRLKLGVTPDGTTTVSVAVYRPDGTAVAGVSLDPGWVNVDERLAQWYATNDGTAGASTTLADGDWLVIWTVTGTGATVAPKVYNVLPLPGTSTRPDWSPFLSDVADHVPWLTVDMVTPGSDIYLRTFTGNTEPTDETAQRHVDSAAAPVAALGTVPAELSNLARRVVAMRAAASLARAFPRIDRSLDVARDLERYAADEYKILIQFMAESGAAPTSSLYPAWSFPTAVAHGDMDL